jgi:hypothetical protein
MLQSCWLPAAVCVHTCSPGHEENECCQTKPLATYLVPGPEVHGVLAILCSDEVVMSKLAEAVAAAAVGLVLHKLCASADIPAER